MRAILGDQAPNISLVFEPMDNFSYYRSLQDNGSDLTLITSGYPILEQDFQKINPVQIIHEGRLNMLSTYKVNDKNDIVYADILTASFKSFDFIVWSAISVAFFVFVGLLMLRRCLNSLKQDKKQGNELKDSPIFETFSHMICQESSDFIDRPGKLISLTMTMGFFFILAYYLNLMCTDLVVETKPPVIKTYRDIIDRKNLTVSFNTGLPDIKEFEEAEEGTIHAQLWVDVRNRTKIVDQNGDPQSGMNIARMIVKQEAVSMMDSLLGSPIRKMTCQIKYSLKESIPDANRIYSWLASDPEGKQQTRGIIIRQGLRTPLFMKGQRILRGLFEGDILSIGFTMGMDKYIHDLFGKDDFYETLKCLSNEVQYNAVKVDVVTLQNFRHLFLIVVFMLIVALFVLIYETVKKPQTRSDVDESNE